MAERYTRVFSLPENLYLEGSPVFIAAGALLKDNENGRIIAQLKFKSLSKKIIKALKLNISTFDTVGNPLPDSVSRDYLDLSIKLDEEFGQKTPIVMPDSSTRAFSVKVTEIIFSDNSFWKNEDETFEQMTMASPLSEKFSDAELTKQYQIKYGNDSKVFPEIYKDLWYCACGAINMTGEDKCHACGKLSADLFSFDIDSLAAEKNARLDKERKEADEAKAAAEIKAKKDKKIAAISGAAIAVCITILLLVTKVVIPNSNYKAAIKIMNAGQYEEAIAAFEDMDGYKDSESMINVCQTAIKDNAYNDALALLDAGKYKEAKSAFSALDGYKDSMDMITETYYRQAAALRNSGEYTKAFAIYKSITGYKDVDSLLETDENLIAVCRVEWATIGAVVTFGAYEQDNNTSNGKEKIEWIVLATEGDKSLVISKYILDCQPYNTSRAEVTWEICTLRTWLNFGKTQISPRAVI